MLLVACAPRPAERPGGDFDLRSEKAVFLALKDVRASDEQRLAVMTAFDETHPRLEALADEAERLLQRWRELDRRDPSFEQQAGALSGQYGDLARERMTLSAKFEERVATTLTEDQWTAWQRYWVRPSFGPRDREPGEGGGRRGRRPG